MKYIKMFELFEPEEYKLDNKYYYKIYWLLPTDERFEDSLKKIKCDSKYMKSILQAKIYKKSPYIFVGYDGSSTVKYLSSRWGWVGYNGELISDYYEEEGYKFGGTINMHESELIANKYNL